jgi:hypothetical protein
MKSAARKLMSLSFLVLFTVSCGRHGGQSPQSKQAAGSGEPPAYVQKAWDARYTYDADRRLLVPQYAGSRWGAVQQYKEEGVLEYQDWWIRDVRTEDLESSPDTIITTFLDEDGVLTEVQSPSSEDSASEEDSDLLNEPEDSEENLNNPVLPSSSNQADDPFVPSPFSPF